MAGRGPAPKDPSRRARRNKDAINLREYIAEPAKQPALPTIYNFHVNDHGDVIRRKFNWPEITRRWWKMWAESPLAPELTDSDWAFLMDTAYIHARFWNGEVKLGPELRLRVAKFGATPEDRARLRIVFAVADNIENDDAQDAYQKVMSGGARDRARSRSVKVI